jgi:NADPH-dependent ferric siderophore reductase
MSNNHDRATDSSAAGDRRPRRVRHELRFRMLTVQRVEQLSPHMMRITFGGDELDGFVSLGFDDHVKVFFPAPGQEVPPRPQLGEKGAIFPEGQPKPVMRDFTPRQYDAAAGTLCIDFALHDSGPATEWARQARSGQVLAIGGPRGSFIVPLDFDWHLLIGDATALPAIARRLEELPDEARVIALIEVEEPADVLLLKTGAGASVHWVYRAQQAPTDALVTALKEIDFPEGDYHAWIGCESATAKRLREVLITERGANPKWVRASGYWRRGATGTHDTFDE